MYSTQAQDVFRKLVEDTVVQTGVTVSISNIMKAISNCNVTVNTAVSPNLWLIPSDLVIIKWRIPGYNNALYRPSGGMKSVLNAGTNYSKPATCKAALGGWESSRDTCDACRRALLSGAYEDTYRGAG